MQNQLVDNFGRAHSYLRISVTDRCNLRCTYCMPEHGIDWTSPEKLLSGAEIIRLADLFVRLGVRKIRLTGGEPLLRPDIMEIVQGLAQLPQLQMLAMTSNGIGLDKRAAIIKQQGLQSLTISLDSLKRERFAEIAKRDRLPEVLAGIEAALAVGLTPLKINIVVMRGINDDELLDFIAWGRDLPVQLRFIEYMPFPDNHWSSGGLLPFAEMQRIIVAEYELMSLKGETSAVGKDFALAGHKATLGFVTSMTESFCSSCNRLRLTADGQIKSCLFHPAERNLRDLLRAGADDAALTEQIMLALRGKPAAHPPMEELQQKPNRAMIAIGG